MYRLATTVNPQKFSTDPSVIESWSRFESVKQIIFIQPVCDLAALSTAINKLPPHFAQKLSVEVYPLISSVRGGLPPLPDLYSLARSLQKLHPNPHSPILFLNSDLIITSRTFFSSLTHSTKKADISYLFRYDITKTGAKLGFYLHGIDAFLIRSSSLLSEPPESFKNYSIGLPCWDHFMPIYTSSIASQNFLQIPTLIHIVHPTSNPGHYSAQIPYLLVDTIAASRLGRRLRPILLLLFQAACQSNLILSILHKLIVFPRLRAIGWPISRSRY